MPIRPENKDRYPDNWPEIRRAILERAGHCCEFCGVENYAVGYWDPGGFFCYVHEKSFDDPSGIPRIKIVLTIAHLDHTPENCDPDNLRALCQKCHNNYDIENRVKERRDRLHRVKADGDLFTKQGGKLPKFLGSITKDEVKRNKTFTYLDIRLTIPIADGKLSAGDKADLDDMFMENSVLVISMERSAEDLWPKTAPLEDKSQAKMDLGGGAEPKKDGEE